MSTATGCRTSAPDCGLRAGLDIVNGYTNQARKLTYVDNWYTVPYPKRRSGSPRSAGTATPDDDHIVKMFIYFSDVDEEAGAFEYVRDSAAAAVRRPLRLR